MQPMSQSSFDTQQSNDRLSEMIVYVAQKCARHRYFGATKLNKILFFADFLSYEKYGQPITGAEYMKLEQGPVPRQLVPQRAALLDSDAIEEVAMMIGSYSQKRIVAKRAARLELFSARDIALVDEIIEDLADLTAKQVSDMSHGFEGWKIANLKETILYQSVFLSSRKPSASDIDWALQLNASEGWNA